MGQIGLGVMIAEMAGWGAKHNESDVKALEGAIIDRLGVYDNELTFTFTNGYRLIVWDAGQSCCEHRYMHTDDDLSFAIGAELTGIEVRGGADEGDDDYSKESQFLIVDTSKGSFTVVNYNEHNGYYGGFSTQTRIERPSAGTW